MASLHSVPDDQLGFDEKVIDDPALSDALEARQEAKADLRDQRKVYKELDSRAKAEIEKLELPDETAVRVGRFRITRRAVPARSVSFETEERSQLSIAFLGDD